ncbi:hypothetical protein J6590_036913 [Homalodisca vitripennis]|nr:hypothetical protein J6590_036913 [Homalodisca vitripennis]
MYIPALPPQSQSGAARQQRVPITQLMKPPTGRLPTSPAVSGNVTVCQSSLYSDPIVIVRVKSMSPAPGPPHFSTLT